MPARHRTRTRSCYLFHSSLCARFVVQFRSGHLAGLQSLNARWIAKHSLNTIGRFSCLHRPWSASVSKPPASAPGPCGATMEALDVDWRSMRGRALDWREREGEVTGELRQNWIRELGAGLKKGDQLNCSTVANKNRELLRFGRAKGSGWRVQGTWYVSRFHGLFSFLHRRLAEETLPGAARAPLSESVSAGRPVGSGHGNRPGFTTNGRPP